jgi:modulator of FtsH protease HflC
VPLVLTPLLIGLVAAVLSLSAMFQVNETQVAIRTQFGEIQGMNYGPGLHMKWPFVDQVVKFERRIVTQNYPARVPDQREQDPERRLLREVAHRGRRPYYRATGGIEDIAARRLAEIVKDGMKGVVARRTLQEIVVAERAEFIGDMFGRASESVKELGIS